MTDTLKRLNPAIAMTALIISLLALLATAAGVGYAAGTVGTGDLKNNAVTAKKIKNNAVKTTKLKNNAVTPDKIKDGSLTAAELVPSEDEKLGQLGNGTEGDCVWTAGPALLAGLGTPSYRKDRFGTVHLSGVAIRSDGPGGDADCEPGPPGQSSDAIMFTLPAGYVPARSMILANGDGGLIIAGPSGISDGSISLPAGAVAPVVTPGGGLQSLDGVSFEPAGSPVILPKETASGQSRIDLGDLLASN